MELSVDNFDDVLGRALPRLMSRLLAFDARSCVVPPSRFLLTGDKRATLTVRLAACLQALETESFAWIGVTDPTSPRR